MATSIASPVQSLLGCCFAPAAVVRQQTLLALIHISQCKGFQKDMFAFSLSSFNSIACRQAHQYQMCNLIVDISRPLQELLGSVDVWICNAGYSGSFKPFMAAEPHTLEAVVKTNLLGTLLCAREAGRIMLQQELGGHIFIMDGAGADGSATPQYAAYGEGCKVSDTTV